MMFSKSLARHCGSMNGFFISPPSQIGNKELAEVNRLNSLYCSCLQLQLLMSFRVVANIYFILYLSQICSLFVHMQTICLLLNQEVLFSYRFMATNDLMSELQKDSIKLDDDSERKVVKMILKLLEDKNGEVQNLAVKWYWQDCAGRMFFTCNKYTYTWKTMYSCP